MNHQDLRNDRQLVRNFAVSRYDSLGRADPTRMVYVWADGLVEVLEGDQLVMEGQAGLYDGRWMVTDLPDDNLAHVIERTLNMSRWQPALEEPPETC